ncbi:TPA: hypothetical protein ACIA3T_004610 [Salmonella enterica subsp. enterica serovar Saintpaul]
MKSEKRNVYPYSGGIPVRRNVFSTGVRFLIGGAFIATLILIILFVYLLTLACS